MKDNVIKAVFDFTHRINDDGTYKVGFEFRADTKDIDISIATKQYRSVIDILIQSYNVSAYIHGQGVVNGKQIADLIWLLNEVDNFVEEIEPMLDKEKGKNDGKDSK